jgi:hypothetical protein
MALRTLLLHEGYVLIWTLGSKAEIRLMTVTAILEISRERSRRQGNIEEQTKRQLHESYFHADNYSIKVLVRVQAVITSIHGSPVIQPKSIDRNLNNLIIFSAPMEEKMRPCAPFPGTHEPIPGA